MNKTMKVQVGLLVCGLLVVLGLQAGIAQQPTPIQESSCLDVMLLWLKRLRSLLNFQGFWCHLNLEGDSVTKDQVLARIDDADALLKRKELTLQLSVAEKEASNDINVRAAEASAEVAEAELRESQAVNAESPGAVPPTKIRREELTFRRAELQVDVAQLELDVAKLNVDVRKTQLDNADLTIDRLKVKSPLNAEVERKLKMLGNLFRLVIQLFN